MSIFSDHECGAMSDDEFRSACARMNAQDRAEQDALERMCDLMCGGPEDEIGTCLNCKHCKTVKIHKRIIKVGPKSYFDGNNELKKDNTFFVANVQCDYAEFEEIGICMKHMIEMEDDDSCDEWEETEEE